MLPHLLEILLVGQEAIQSYYPPVQIILILNGSPLVIKQWGKITGTATVRVTFPVSFATTNYIVSSGVEGNNALTIYATMITNKSTNSVTIYIDDTRSFTKTYIAAGS